MNAPLPILSGLRSFFRRLAQKAADDAGLLDEDSLRELLLELLANEIQRLDSHELLAFLESIYIWCGFCRVSGQLAIRNTAKARTKAALVEIGRVATKAEIAHRAGLDPARIGSTLSNLPSVARADKRRWGLAEWIDDVYEGIPAEIIQRINEEGGSVHLSRLLEELPQKFGVTPASVRAYAYSQAFRIEHGWVRLADQLDFDPLPLEDVVDGYTSSGEPYWTFEMHHRYREGYSLVGVPPELVVAMGGDFGCNIRVPVLAPPGARDVSVIWRKTTLTGAEIGRIAEPLRILDPRPGDLIRLVIHTSSGVSFTPYRPNHHRHLDVSSRFSDSQDLNPLNFKGPHTGVVMGVPIVAELPANIPEPSSRSTSSSRPVERGEYSRHKES